MGLVSHTNNEYLDLLESHSADEMTRVLGLHPSYQDIYKNTKTHLLAGDGPLPAKYRHYIAIMASSRSGCEHLVEREKVEFLSVGGDPSWLEGLHRVPYKLRRLGKINKILAHRPWLLNQTHIKSLTTGDESWSLSEIVHAIVILVHFHAASSFVFGCGFGTSQDGSFNASRRTGSLPRSKRGKEKKTDSQGKLFPDIQTEKKMSLDKEQDLMSHSNGENKTENHNDTQIGISPKLGSPSFSLPGSPSGGDKRVCVDTLMRRMRTLSERVAEVNQDEMSKRFESIECQAAAISPSKSNLSTEVPSSIARFIDDVNYQYEDFSQMKRDEANLKTFRVQDYSWDEHGFTVLSRFYSDISLLLDDKFRLAANMTYNCMGEKQGVDTSTFRRAVWNYIQCIYGIRHDDYDYGEINQLLERSLKAFIKTACCFPAKLSSNSINKVMTDFEFPEKVHVIIMGYGGENSSRTFIWTEGSHEAYDLKFINVLPAITDFL